MVEERRTKTGTPNRGTQQESVSAGRIRADTEERTAAQGRAFRARAHTVLLGVLRTGNPGNAHREIAIETVGVGAMG